MTNPLFRAFQGLILGSENSEAPSFREGQPHLKPSHIWPKPNNNLGKKPLLSQSQRLTFNQANPNPDLTLN